MGSLPRLQWAGKWKHTVYKAIWQMREVEMGRVIKLGCLGYCIGWRRVYMVTGLAAQCCASACMSIDCVQGWHVYIHTYIHTYNYIRICTKSPLSRDSELGITQVCPMQLPLHNVPCKLKENCRQPHACTCCCFALFGSSSVQCTLLYYVVL